MNDITKLNERLAKAIGANIEEANEWADIDLAKFGITPEQYHAGLNKLWPHVTADGRDIFTLIDEKLTQQSKALLQADKTINDMGDFIADRTGSCPFDMLDIQPWGDCEERCHKDIDIGKCWAQRFKGEE